MEQHEQNFGIRQAVASLQQGFMGALDHASYEQFHLPHQSGAFIRAQSSSNEQEAAYFDSGNKKAKLGVGKELSVMDEEGNSF